MTRGYPDWSNVRKSGLIVSLSDMAELAARLGSYVTYDRQGDTLYIETFRNGISAWTVSGTATTYRAVATANRVLRGPLAARLETGTDANGSCRVERGIPTSVGNRVGIASTFTLFSPIDWFRMDMVVADGVNARQFGLRYDDAAQTLSFLNSAGGWTAFASGLDLNTAGGWWYDWKVVADLSTEYYGTARIANLGGDLSSQPIRKTASATAPYIGIALQVKTTATGEGAANIDSVLVTINEP